MYFSNEYTKTFIEYQKEDKNCQNRLISEETKFIDGIQCVKSPINGKFVPVVPEKALVEIVSYFHNTNTLHPSVLHTYQEISKYFMINKTQVHKYIHTHCVNCMKIQILKNILVRKRC